MLSQPCYDLFDGYVLTKWIHKYKKDGKLLKLICICVTSCVHVYDWYHAALVDIRQCTATNVIKPKVVKDTLQWRSERKCKVSSVKPNWQVNWTYNAIILLLFDDKSGHMINYPLYDAIHEKRRTLRKSNPCIPQSSSKPNFIIIHNVYAFGMQAVLYELEMLCAKILQLLYDVTDTQTLIKRNI